MMLSQVCVFLGDVRRAATLYTLLHPYAGRNVVSGRSLKACYGPVSYYLGLLATLLARWDEAEQHFNDALALNAKMGARPWEAHTQHDYACMLLARRHPGDQEKAQALLALALATAQELGMTGLQSPVPGAASRRQERAASLPCLSAGRHTQDAGRSCPRRQSRGARRTEYLPPRGRLLDAGLPGAAVSAQRGQGSPLPRSALALPGREFHVADLAALTPPHPRAPGARPPTTLRPEDTCRAAFACHGAGMPGRSWMPGPGGLHTALRRFTSGPRRSRTLQ